MNYTHQNVHYFQEWAVHWETGCSFELQLGSNLDQTLAALFRCLLETGKLHHNMDNAHPNSPVPLALQRHQWKLLKIKHVDVAKKIIYIIFYDALGYILIHFQIPDWGVFFLGFLFDY